MGFGKEPRNPAISQLYGEFQEAEEWFDRALNQYADFGMAWDALGDVRQKQGKWQEALKAYEEGKRQGHLQSARDLCRLLKESQ